MTKEQLFERLDEKLGTLRKAGLDVDLAQGRNPLRLRVYRLGRRADVRGHGIPRHGDLSPLLG